MIHSTLISSFLQIQPGWVLDFQHKNFGETQIFKPRQHIKKQRHYFAYKSPYSQSYGFPAVMYGCESWTIKKAEGRRTDAFELWCWRRLLRVPWTARRSNQSILKRSVLSIHWKDWCSSWNSNTLATWCEELTHWKRPWCWERLKVGEGDDRGWDGWMASPTLMGLQRVGHDWATELNQWWE